MKPMTGKFLESCRMCGDRRWGFNGAFVIPFPVLSDEVLRVIVSDGGGWDHVSVSRPDRTPTWEEMCFIKDLFFDEHEMVMQFHPPKADYVNCHPHWLNLWRPQAQIIPRPPAWMVGPKLQPSARTTRTLAAGA